MNRDWIPAAGSAGPVLLPGVYDGLSARLAEMAGFRAVYASGGAISRSAGVPDIGLLTLTEVLDRLAKIADAAPLAVVADGETGFGGPASIRRTAREFARLGLAAFHIEDQDTPRRCGVLPGIKLISVDEMCLKVRAARDAVRDPDFLVIGRTDATDVEGLDRAIERANAYAAAGADLVYVEALSTREQLERVAEAVAAPKVVSMIGSESAPPLSAEELVALGFPVVIVPNDVQRAAIAAMQRALGCLAAEGSTSSMARELITMADREEISRTSDYLDVR
ncbi:oxaloacetate decarboxylase [Amycolatopsis sp. Poz14]|uniref:isocitrate lyase/PEP mutase family protein n=1 Tax=Amycolatopsis sp. Poz14 TaxID=1447705 RepID=UPI001EE7C52C|nr:isocitrate lyase/PEP mutase family protein [Amycolatopsis sp. Poz14]MCG3753970.1 isocitrate lyase/PEP mutase family protein [Amycolatopsis sp. Poz14]